VEAVPPLTDAIVRIPGRNFADGLTTVDLGIPNFELALQQHARYCEALVECGLRVITLDADLHHPDSTFVEDTAILTPHGSILTRPGADSRAGEVAAMGGIIRTLFPSTFQIEAPGTLDGGDICEVENHFFIGISHRTNEEGARQLAMHLNGMGYTSSTIDLRAMTSILHLKSGISYIGDNTMVAIEDFAEDERLRTYNIIRVAREESYAANCIRIDNQVLIPAGYPLLSTELTGQGFNCLPLPMSEFQKMDGGLSCLSLRY
jgi:dimethylargininase